MWHGLTHLISYDHFIRTTEDYHKEQVAKAFKKFVDQGDIEKAQYEGWYCISCESFYPESQIENGHCLVCGGPVHKEKEESYFFKLSKYQKQLEQHILDNPISFVLNPVRTKWLTISLSLV